MGKDVLLGKGDWSFSHEGPRSLGDLSLTARANMWNVYLPQGSPSLFPWAFAPWPQEGKPV